MYKVIAVIISNDDNFVTKALIFSGFVNIIGKLITPFIWETFGFYGSYILMELLTLLNLFLYLFYGTNSLMLFFQITIIRTILTFSYIIGYYSTFGLFKPKVAVFIGRAFDFNYLTGFLIGLITNRLFFSQQDLKTVFRVHFILNFVGLVLIVLFYKDFDKNPHIIKRSKK